MKPVAPVTKYFMSLPHARQTAVIGPGSETISAWRRGGTPSRGKRSRARRGSRSTAAWIVSRTCSDSSNTVARSSAASGRARTGRSARRTRSATWTAAAPRPTHPSAGKVGVIGKYGAPIRRASSRDSAELRIDLLRPDDRDRDDRRAGAQRDLDEAAAPEPLQPVALGERLAGALRPLREDHHQVPLLEQPDRVVGRGDDPPTRRMNALTHGSRNAQSSTMKRGCRGSGWFFRIATLIIVASQGSTPAWLATSSARSVRRDVLHAGRRHPPPAVVHELEERIDDLDELLVEAPLVLRVLTAQAGGTLARRRGRIEATAAPRGLEVAAVGEDRTDEASLTCVGRLSDR